jgi:transposase
VRFDDYQPRPRIEELVRMPLEHALDQLLADVLADQLAKSINDAAWGQFLSWLRSYGAIANVPVVAVSPKFTTQDCFGCGERVKKSLSVRTHVCPQCGLVLDRDENAALNILSATLDSPLSTPYRRAGGNGSLFRAAQRFWTEDR